MEENFSAQESLQLIQSMIAKAKDNLGKNNFYFLLWGWVTFLTIVAQFLLKVVFKWEHHYFVWLVVIPTMIVTIIYSSQKAKKLRVRTYIGESMRNLWTGIGISFFVLSFIISNSQQGWFFAYPFFILFYGLGTFVSGRILKFSPLVIGGIINWALAILCVYVDFDYQLLIAAAAILISYIIPGHLLGIKKN